WAVLGIVAGLEFTAAGAAFLWSNRGKSRKNEEEKLITIGAVNDFKPGTVTAFRPGRLFISRLEKGGFLALSLKCTHLGCSVIWQEKEDQFICPCHSSAFDKLGNVLNPPANKALDIFPLTIANDQVVVNITRPVKRDGFSDTQLIYPPQKNR
ncbi:MAG: Rieske (2Fe-2S) protein, partial [Calditrichales bacterium]